VDGRDPRPPQPPLDRQVEVGGVDADVERGRRRAPVRAQRAADAEQFGQVQ
jgi:hypothetical protein